MTPREQAILNEGFNRYTENDMFSIRAFECGAHWSDTHPSGDTIKKVVDLYKQWLSQQLDGDFVTYIKNNF